MHRPLLTTATCVFWLTLCHLPVSGAVLVEDAFDGANNSPPDSAKWEWSGEAAANGTGQLNLQTWSANRSWILSKAGAAPTASRPLVLYLRAYAYAENWTPGVYGDQQPRGLRVGNDANNAVEFYSLSRTSLGLRIRKEGVESTAACDLPSGVDSMRDYEISVTSTSATFKVDGVAVGTLETSPPSGALNVHVSTDDGGFGNVPVTIDLLSLVLTDPPEASDFSYTNNGQSVTITGYTGPGGAVTIPATINGLPVTGIGKLAFYLVDTIGQVTIPESVTNLEFGAFAWCTGLGSVTIPSSIGTIGVEAFYYCGGLTNVSFSQGVTNIDNLAFAGCSSLTNLTLPESLQTLGNSAFATCSSLREIYFLGNAPSAGVGVLSGDDNATVYYLPGTTGWGATYCGRPAVLLVTSVPYTYATNSGSITIQRYTGAGGVVSVPAVINGLPVTSVGINAFYSCPTVTSISIPDSVTSIGYSAFESCVSLTNVTLGRGVTNIGYHVFFGCSSLAAFQVDPQNPSFSSVDGILFDKGQATLLVYPASRTGNYTVPIGVRLIADGAFDHCGGLTGVTLPDTVKDIGSGAFYACTSVTNVSFGAALTNIGNLAFYHCTSLTSIALPDSVISINGAFNDCASLASVTLGSSVADIGGAFVACASLRSISIPASVRYLGAMAFSGCTGLTNVTLPETLTAIGGSAFSACARLSTLAVPNSVTNIGAYAFQNCYALTGLTGGMGVTTIGGSAFKSCLALRSLALPGQVTIIGDNAFSDCASLTNITIPSGVTAIGAGAFSGCTSLARVVIPAGITRIEGWMFYQCSSLAEVYFSGDAPTFGYSVFDGANSAIVYYQPGTRGWNSTFAERPAAVNPESVYAIATRGLVMGCAFDGSNALAGIEDHASPIHTIGAQMMSANGTRLGPLIATGRSGKSTAVEFDGTNYLLIWEDDGLGTLTNAGCQIYGQFISKSGSAVGAPFDISGLGVQFTGIKPMAFGGGKHLVTYDRLTGLSTRYIAGRIVNPDGTVGSEFRISTGFGKASEVAFDGNNFFVIWCEDGMDTEIRGRFVSPAGVPGTEISVNGSAEKSDNPKAVAFDGINYLVVWNDEMEGAGTRTWDAFGQLVGPGGALVGGTITLTAEPGPQMVVAVACDGANYLAAWVDMQNGTNWDLYGRFISRSGSPIGGKITISTDPGNQMGGVGFANGKYLALINNGVVMGPGGIEQVDSATAVLIQPLPTPRVLANDPTFGIRNNQFGFTVTGANGTEVVVEACASFTDPAWSPLSTNVISGGSWYFSDPQWMTYPARYYRLRSP